MNRLASRLGKKVKVELRNPDLRIDSDLLSPLINNLTHLMRNSVDHGIEILKSKSIDIAGATANEQANGRRYAA